MELIVEQVHKSFQQAQEETAVQALRGITLHIPQGAFVSLIGPSGCGKSTLLRLIAGLEQPTGGTISMHGEPVRGGSARAGFVFQEYALFPWRTVSDNISFQLEMKGVAQDIRRKRAREYIERFGLSGFAEAYPAQLSGGMKQRVAIARSLIDGADVLLMDEPFGALDSQTRAHMQKFLLGVWQETGSTMLMVTHNIDEAVSLGQRVVCFTKRPGSIGADIAIDLPYPRDVTSDQFNTYRREILVFLDRQHSGSD